MPVRLTRAAYEALVREDLVWLNAQPRTLEREHIRTVLAWSADALYGSSRVLQESSEKPDVPGHWLCTKGHLVSDQDGSCVDCFVEGPG